MKSICVFCGSRLGKSSSHTEAARQFAKVMTNRGLSLIYGGSSVGLMGTLANEVLLGGGKVTGVLPQKLKDKELAHTKLSEMIVVETLHERKQKKFELSDGFVALPGGLGTFEEFFEVLTWQQFGSHKKPCGILNVDGFFDPLLEMLERVCAEGYLSESHRNMILVSTQPEDLVKQMLEYSPRRGPSGWIDQKQT